MEDGSKVRTIIQLAELAGVSPGTVSRALADSALISKATRERIQQLAREHGFRPNVMARNFRFGRTGAIGAVMPAVSQHLDLCVSLALTTMLSSLSAQLAERGYALLLSSLEGGIGGLRHLMESGRVDGIVLLGRVASPEDLAAVASEYRPLVAVGQGGAVDGLCTVATDGRMFGELAAAHLIERGAGRLAFVSDGTTVDDCLAMEGIGPVAAAAGVTARHIKLADRGASQCEQIAQWWDSEADRPDGIICASDSMALRMESMLAQRGVRVPQEAKVTGQGDLGLAELGQPALTSLRLDYVNLIAALVDRLLDRIAGDAAPSVLVPPKLTVRQST